jgi:hypothetical protein
MSRKKAGKENLNSRPVAVKKAVGVAAKGWKRELDSPKMAVRMITAMGRWLTRISKRDCGPIFRVVMRCRPRRVVAPPGLTRDIREDEV